MLKLQSTAPTHEELFLRSYDRMFGWALQLTNRNREQAEDLVQDAFIEFTLSHADLNSIRNLDSYLHAVLRNMHMSRVRRATQYQHVSFSVANYDSAEISLRAGDLRDQLRVKEELRQICHYTCVRKQTSKAGSVLVLRFFHGYYPSEVAKILLSPGRVVDKWLWLARREARAYLEDPGSLRFMVEPQPAETRRAGGAQTAADFLSDLRQAIFHFPSGECPTPSQLRELYHAQEAGNVNCQILSHLVSCRRCLDAVNGLLGLSPLLERHPTDSAGKDTRSSGESGGGGGLTGSGGAQDRTRQFKRRLRDVIEHKPQELRVAVNGFVLGTQNVRSDLSALTLSLNGEEKLGFIEVLSEQDVRLMFLEVGQPPEGEVEQQKRVEFSEGRTLETTLSFNTQWPTLHVAYHDPTFVVAESEVDSLEPGIEEESGIALPKSGVQGMPSWRRSLRHRIPPWIASKLQSLEWKLFFRPGTVTSIFAILLIVALVFVQLWRGPVPLVSAAELLKRSSVAEEAQAARTDQVLRRIISLEEKRTDGALIARRQIEVWHSAGRSITARRLYNEHGQLIAGDWRRADGVQTVYHHGSRPQLQLAPEKRAGESLTFDSVWQLQASAQEFTSLIGRIDDAQVEEIGNGYLISYRKAGLGDARGLVKATLILSRADLHATEQTVVVQQGSEQREYRFAETSFERRTPNSVAPVVFEPDPELLVPAAMPTDKTTDPGKDASASFPPQPAAPALANAELEVEALQLLNQAGADIDDQTSVTRTAEGKLRISGLLESDQRKAEIVKALSPIIRNPSVVVELETVAEALNREQRRQKQSQSSSGQVAVQRVEITRAQIPVHEDLKKYFGNADGQSEEQIREFAAAILDRSRRAMSHVGTLSRLAGRFSQDELRSLSPEARARWLAVIRSHSRAFEQETRTIRQQLQPIFLRATPSSDASIDAEIVDDASRARAIERLLAIGAENDNVIRSAFSISAERSTTTAIRSPEFWRSLKSAESLAAKISRQ
jgi:RNA polymerase sigma factor (sigma-70 family)